MRENKLYIGWALATLLLIHGCSTTKELGKEEYLLTDTEMKVKEGDLFPEVKESLEQIVLPSTNNTFLGLRVKLWVFQKTKDSEKGPGKWLRERFGEQPVLLNSVDTNTLATKAEEFLFNEGYFNSSAATKTSFNGKKAEVSLVLHPGPPRFISNFSVDSSLPNDTGSLPLPSSHELLEKGERFSVEQMKKVRQDFAIHLQDKGYYFFNATHLSYDADTSGEGGQVDLSIRIAPPTPTDALKKYRIGQVKTFIGDLSDTIEDSLSVDPVILSSHLDIDTSILHMAILLEEGNIFSREDQVKTLDRLSSLGIFKFTDMNISRSKTKDRHLDIRIDLTPLKRQTIDAELEAVTTSNNFSGPGIKLGLTDRNTFGGAEKMNFDLGSRFETQLGGTEENLYSFEAKGGLTLEFPGIRSPFNIQPSKTAKIPSTHTRFGYTFQDRIRYFSLHSFNMEGRYHWKSDPTLTENLVPASIELLSLGHTTSEFEDILEQQPLLKESFQEQFIPSTRYSLVKNTQLNEVSNSLDYFFKGEFTTAGNLMKGITLLIGEETSSKQETALGVPFAQYVRGETEFVLYRKIKKSLKWVNRLTAGIGIPHGNSQTLPYTERFHAGGSNSIRGFRARSVGPGSYTPPEEALQNPLIAQTGDIKIEGNTEIRFPIYSYLKGAVFVDAGNVWVLNEDPSQPGGQFKSDTFLSQIAVASGAGVRLDLDFFVIRLDLGFPLRKPYYPQGKRWVWEELQPSEGQWWKNELVWNLGIGYPF